MRFRQKLLLCMVWLFVLSYGIGGTLLIAQSFRQSLKEQQTTAAASYQMTLRTLSLFSAIDTQQNFSNVSIVLSQIESSSDWCAVKLYRNTDIIYQSGTAFAELSPEEDALMTVFTLDDCHYLQVSGRLYANEAAVQLDIVYPIESLYQMRAKQISTYRQIFLILLAAGAVLSLLLSYFLTKPLYRVSRASKKLAQGELNARADVHSNDEVGALAKNFNQMAERMEQTISELQQTTRQQEDFIASFAHEMKTPMTSIIGYADLLRGQTLSEEEQVDAANYIFSEGKRLQSLSMKMLDLLVVKNQMPHLVCTEMSSLLRSLVEHLQPVYGQLGIDLQARCAAGKCMVEPDLFRSLMVNLLDNARKAMESGGNIFILSDSTDGNYRIRVVDNGCGIPEEALAHLTEAFYRVDKSRSRKQGGVGLGLSLCRRIIDLHDGSLQFASRQGGGTCVSVFLKEAEE